MSGKQKKAEHANTITALIQREAEYQKVKAALLGSDLGQSGLFTSERNGAGCGAAKLAYPQYG